MIEFRVKFVTKDGQLVQDRLSSDSSFWLDQKFVDHSLQGNCREKGVRLVSYKRVPTGILAMVEWLK